MPRLSHRVLLRSLLLAVHTGLRTISDTPFLPALPFEAVKLSIISHDMSILHSCLSSFWVVRGHVMNQ